METIELAPRRGSTASKNPSKRFRRSDSSFHAGNPNAVSAEERIAKRQDEERLAVESKRTHEDVERQKCYEEYGRLQQKE